MEKPINNYTITDIVATLFCLSISEKGEVLMLLTVICKKKHRTIYLKENPQSNQTNTAFNLPFSLVNGYDPFLEEGSSTDADLHPAQRYTIQIKSTKANITEWINFVGRYLPLLKAYYS